MANDINIVVSAQVGDATKGLQQVQQQVQRVDRQIKNSTKVLAANANQYNSNAVSTNKWAKGALQQAGYQVGDFAVQLGGGQNALQAFGQQGSQLLGIFGPIGAVLGAGVAIVAAVGVAFQKTAAATKVAKREFMTLDQVDLGSIRSAVSGLKNIQEAYNKALEDSGTASTSSSRLTVANSEKEFNARKQLLTVERELLRLRSQDQISALKNMREQQERTRQAAMEISRNLGPGATFDPSAAAGGFAGAAIDANALETALGGTLNQLRTNRREILQLEAELTRLGIASDEAGEAVKMVFDPDGTIAETVEVASGGASAMQRIADVVNNEVSPALVRLKSVQDTVSRSIESGLMSMVDGTKSVKDAFKSMASEIIKELYRIFVVQQITGMIANAIGGMGGTSPVNGSVRPMARNFAGGGYTGNGSRSGGLDGKGGYMAMVHPRESIIDHTRGQSAGGVTVNQTINVSTGVQQTVRTEIKTLMPQIANAAKAAVADAKLRGGSYGRSFA